VADAGAPLELSVVSYDHPDAVALVEAVQLVYVERYGGIDATPVDPAEFAPPTGMFLVGYLNGAPVCCGGWRTYSACADGDSDGEADADADADAELKRMYVVDQARGRGFARRLLAELERTAMAAGARRMVLETGTRQPEAIGLYRSAGYQPIPAFGVYRCAPRSRYFGKPLG
jgi:GNAT superfamily N-acetyltransferase